MSETLFPEVEIIMETRVFGSEIPGLWLGKPPREVRKREEVERGEEKRGKKEELGYKKYERILPRGYYAE